MKKYVNYYLGIIVCFAIPFQLKAQLKVTTTGELAVGGNFTPNGKLHVLGNAVFSTSTTISYAPMIRATTTTSSTSTPDFTWWGADQTGIFHPSAHEIGFTLSNSEKMRLDPYKIALNNLQYGFQINATGTTNYGIVIKYSGADKFYVLGSGDAWGKSWTSWSDRVLKDNIKPITNALDKVLKLQGVTYNFKSDLKDNSSVPRSSIGLIAQEVEPIVPEVVNTNDKGMKGIEYSNLVALLVEAIKAQNKKMEALESQLAYCCSNRQEGTNSTLENGATLNSSTNLNQSSPRLLQNTPNPFNQQTTIGYYLPTETKSAALMIFDMQGKLLKTVGVTSMGSGSVLISANELSAGIYMYSLIADGKEIDSKRMILTQ